MSILTGRNIPKFNIHLNQNTKLAFGFLAAFSLYVLLSISELDGIFLQTSAVGVDNYWCVFLSNRCWKGLKISFQNESSTDSHAIKLFIDEKRISHWPVSNKNTDLEFDVFSSVRLKVKREHTNRNR